MGRLAFLKLTGAAALALAVTAPAHAESLNSTYSVRLYGAPVGQMVMGVNTGNGAYAAKGEFRTTGLVGLLARVRFTMRSRGTGAPIKMAPRSYSEDLDTGYRTSATSLSFSAGDGRIDPLIAMLAALIDRPAEQGCDFDGKTFDGKRTMTIRIRKTSESDDGLNCTGQIRRVSGYTAEEMAQATGFPFTLQLAKSGDGLTVRRADVATIHGDVSLVRR